MFFIGFFPKPGRTVDAFLGNGEAAREDSLGIFFLPTVPLEKISVVGGEVGVALITVLGAKRAGIARLCSAGKTDTHPPHAVGEVGSEAFLLLLVEMHMAVNAIFNGLQHHGEKDVGQFNVKIVETFRAKGSGAAPDRGHQRKAVDLDQLGVLHGVEPAALGQGNDLFDIRNRLRGDLIEEIFFILAEHIGAGDDQVLLALEMAVERTHGIARSLGDI